MIRSKVSGSQTLALLDRVRALKISGKDIVSFAAGEADFDTPAAVIEESLASIKRGNTRYVSTHGEPALLEAIAHDYTGRLNVPWITPAHILPCFGAKQGIYLVLANVLEPGDEVLVPKPYWVSYPGIVKSCSGKVVEVSTQESNDFFPTPAELDRAWTPRTRALIFSSPNNPLGTMIRKEALQDLVAWCTKKQVLLLFDEIYERLVLDPKREHINPLSLGTEQETDCVVSINACSKSLAMTGWRLGYLVASKSNIEALSSLQSQMITCLPGFIQEGAARGLREADSFLPAIVETYRRRLSMMLEGLSKIPHIRFVRPAGAFYVAVDVHEILVRKKMRSDVDFCERLLNQELVACLAGTSMGMPGWIRLSFATSDERVREGLIRLARFIAS